MLADGNSIPFEQFHNLYGQGEEIPEVASWDVEAKRIVYQRPIKILAHPNSEWENMIDLQCNTQDGQTLNSPLEVTDRHELLTGFFDSQWPRVLDLYDQTPLVTSAGLCFFNDSLTRSGAPQSVVYNLSFTSTSGNEDLIPNFLVSPDGIHWLVAHNMIVKT
jgi:hypothetical protein